MKTYRDSWGVATRILDLGTSTPRPLYPKKEPRYPLDRRLSGPQIQSGSGGEEKSPIIVPVGNWTPVIQPSYYTDWAIPARWI
jgi:hypothetical protein